MKKKFPQILKIFFAVFIFIILVSLLYYFMDNNENINDSYKEENLSSFLMKVKKKNIYSINFVNDEKIKYTTFNNTKHISYLPKSLQKNIITILYNNGAVITYISQKEPTKKSKLTEIFFDIVLFLVFIFLIRSQFSNSLSNVTKTSSTNEGEKSSTKFSDVAGIDAFRSEVEEIVDFLKNPTKYTSRGIKMPKGVLLVGPPGTGKTLIAKAVAGEANVPFFPATGSDFVEMFVGVGAARIRALFEKAIKNAPAIIFIDEIDAIGQKRSDRNMGSQEHSNTLVALLSLMDGFYNNNVIVIAATNIVRILDSALLRPGRFDRIINVPLPDIKGREEIIKLVLSKIKIPYSINIQELARQTIQFSGAQLTNLINEALFLVAKYNRDTLTSLEINEALSKILFGIGRKGNYNMEDKMLVAYHEAGHCILSHIYRAIVWPIFKLTIVTHGDALGFLASLPNNDSIFQNKEYLEAQIQICLGGRAAEEVFFGRNKITNGATSDLQQATNICNKMIGIFGMTHHGLYQLNNDTYQIMSENMKQLIYEEGNKLLENYYKQTLNIIKEYENTIHKIVFYLLKYETLYKEDIENIINDNLEIVGENSNIQIYEDLVNPLHDNLIKF
jgi:cell division protease FtsH